MTSLIVKQIISEYYPDSKQHCYLPSDILILCLDYIVDIIITEYNNGKLLSETPYVNGKIHGFRKKWYGRICGRKHRIHPFIGRSENEHLHHKYHYVNGKLHGVCKSWHTKLHGVCKSWHKCGVLDLETQYVNGKIHGLYLQEI